MATGCGDFQRAFGVKLPADLCEIVFRCGGCLEKRLTVYGERNGVPVSGQEIHHFGQCLDTVHFDLVNDRSLPCVLGRENQRMPVFTQHADG